MEKRKKLSRKKSFGRGINLVKRVSIMLLVVERGDKFLKSKFVRGLVNHVLVVDKSPLEMKILLIIVE